MIRKTFFLGVLVAGALIISGCTGNVSRVAIDYGTSYKLAKFGQALDPEAEKNLQPVTGFDGQAAEKSVERYRKDFEKPLPTPTYTFTVGNIGRSTGMTP